MVHEGHPASFDVYTFEVEIQRDDLMFDQKDRSVQTMLSLAFGRLVYELHD